jgi:hypothetical protein
MRRSNNDVGDCYDNDDDDMCDINDEMIIWVIRYKSLVL